MNKKILIAGILLIIFFINIIGSTVSIAVNQVENATIEEENLSVENENTDSDENTNNENINESADNEENSSSENSSEEDKDIVVEENESSTTNTENSNEVDSTENEIIEEEAINEEQLDEEEQQDAINESTEVNALSVNATSNSEIGVKYQGQGEDYGWQSWVSNGELAGTTGESRRLEGIRIELENAPTLAKIQYRAHGEGYGWQGWVSNGELAGTDGESKRIEGIEIRLVNMPGYSIEYRAHGEDYGWQDWVSDGELAGTTGISKRIEGLEIRIVKKSGEDPEPEEPEEKELTLTYQGQCESYGWQSWVSEGELAGTDGQSKRLEGIKIKLENAPEDAKIIYQAHGEGYGWQNYVSDGELAGTDGESKRMEGIKIQLVNLDEYSVEYRAQVESYGWLPWVSDGELAGTTGESKRLEGLEIRIVPKMKHSKVEIENPTRTIITSPNLDISGYVLSEHENTVLKVYVDSKLVSVTRSERNDVFANNETTSTNINVNYGDISINPTPGYSGIASLSGYNDGKHTVYAKLYDSTGNTLLASDSKDFMYYTDRTYGIDVSKYQGNINWSGVKQSNVDFAMVRIGYRGYGTGKIVADNYYEQNLRGAMSNGIECGVYFFSQAINRDEGVEEANWVLEKIKGYDLTYPIAIDTEWSNSDKDGRADNISVEDRTAAIQGFVETIRNAGYTPIIYASKDWLKNQLDMSKLSGHDVWLAHYVSGAPENTSDYTGYYTIWQYTSEGSVNGITGNVDLDISYKKY